MKSLDDEQKSIRCEKRICYAYFYSCGAAAVSSWTCLLLTLDYFLTKYPRGRFNYVLPIVNMSVLLGVTIFMLLFGRTFALEKRILSGYLIALLGVIGLVLSQTNQAYPLSISYYLTLLCVMASSLGGAIMQSSVYGLGGIFGPEFMQALEAGKGCAGFVLVIIRCVLKWYFGSSASVGENAMTSIVIFFGVCVAIYLISAVLFVVMHFLPYAKIKLSEYQFVQVSTPIGHKSQNKGQLCYSYSFERLSDEKTSEISPLLIQHMQPSNDGGCNRSPRSKNSDKVLAGEDVTVGKVFMHTRKTLFMIFFTYFVCLSCFPGLSSSSKSTTFNLMDWFPIVLVTSYNTGDYIGKSLPSIGNVFNVNTITYPLIYQVLIVPLFAVNVWYPLGDLYIISLVFFLGCSTGYVGTCSVILTPTQVPEFEKEMAGIMSSLACISGLFVGSYMGLLIGLLL